jgi:hypothetical protein
VLVEQYVLLESDGGIRDIDFSSRMAESRQSTYATMKATTSNNKQHVSEQAFATIKKVACNSQGIEHYYTLTVSIILENQF